MSELNEDSDSARKRGGGRWMGLTAYQQLLLLPPILLLAGTLAIPGVDPQISVAGGALALALVLLGLFWPEAAGRGKKRFRGHRDDDESQDSDPRRPE